MVLGAPALAEGGVAQGRRDVKWLPYHRFEIASPLSLQAAMDAMRAHVEPVKWFRWRWPSAHNDDRFEGEIGADSFHARRILGYRNSFAPEIRGTISATGRHARVTIEMKPSALVLAFLAVWTTGIVAGSVALIGADPSLVWLPLLMLAFAYLMTLGGFWFEATKQERVLRQIFQGGHS
jgi:hypothetical protein